MNHTTTKKKGGEGKRNIREGGEQPANWQQKKKQNQTRKLVNKMINSGEINQMGFRAVGDKLLGIPAGERQADIESFSLWNECQEGKGGKN